MKASVAPETNERKTAIPAPPARGVEKTRPARLPSAKPASAKPVSAEPVAAPTAPKTADTQSLPQAKTLPETLKPVQAPKAAPATKKLEVREPVQALNTTTEAIPSGMAEPQAEAPEAPAAPVEALAPAPTARPPEPRPQQQMANGRPIPPSRAAAKEENFVEGDFVVYPTHGVGKVEKIAVEDIAGHRLELIHITFEENRMTLRVPVAKARSAGLRKLATRKMFDEALAVLKGRARIKRTMWSRRAQEYEAKINSGDPIAIAEVVRDLHRNAGQPDQSFSERQIYEAALDRLAAELAALDLTDKSAATVKLGNYLKTV